MKGNRAPVTLSVSAYHISAFLYKYGFFILTLPLQTFFLRNSSSYVLAYVYISNAFLVAGIILFACISYKHIRASLSEKAILLKSGIIMQKRTLIPTDAIDCLCITQGPFQRRLGVSRVTPVCSKCKPYVYLKTFPSFLAKKIYKNEQTEIHQKYVFNNSIFSTLILSTGFYNAFTGALALIPFLKKISSILDPQGNTYQLQHSFFSLPYYNNLSDLFLYLPFLIVLLWALGIIVTFLRYFPLKTTLWNTACKVERGAIIRHTAYIKNNKISSVVLSQNLLMILLNRYTGEFRISGEKKETKVTFLCGATLSDCNRFLRTTEICHNSETPTAVLKPTSLQKYIYLPVISLCVLSAILILSDFFFPYISRIRFGVFLTLWLIGWFFFRMCIFYRCFFSVSPNTITMGCYKGLTFHLAYIPKEHIRKLQLSQTLFQRLTKTCSLKVYIKGRKPIGYLIKHIDKEKAAKVILDLCG